MPDALNIVKKLAAATRRATGKQFVAPCVSGGLVRMRIEGVVMTMRPVPKSFAGWGVFRTDGKAAKLVREANETEREAYMGHFPRLRLRLAVERKDGSWYAWPRDGNRVDTIRKGLSPVAVRCVDSCTQFDAVHACWDGASWWFAGRDGQDDLAVVDAMRLAFARRAALPRVAHLAPEHAACYQLSLDPFSKNLPDVLVRDREALQSALERGGGQLVSYEDQGDRWTVHWVDGRSIRRTSSVSKTDMTVLTAGICLSGRDKDFDLISLVGVVDRSSDHGHDDYDDEEED